LILNINLLNYGTNLRPDICVYFETYKVSDSTTAEDVERAYNRFAQECFNKQGAK